VESIFLKCWYALPNGGGRYFLPKILMIPSERGSESGIDALILFLSTARAMRSRDECERLILKCKLIVTDFSKIELQSQQSQKED
jgi:hypothetical protein